MSGRPGAPPAGSRSVDCALTPGPLLAKYLMAENQDINSDSTSRGPSITDGMAIIDSHLRGLPGSPGVYRMINGRGDVLYVGKAKNLKKRVGSYTAASRLSRRILRKCGAWHVPSTAKPA